MKDPRGFTLLEILVVLVIVGIGVTIATTNFFSWQNHYSGIGFQREFLSKFNEARTRSMAFSLQHRLLIDWNADNVALQRGNAGTGTSTWPETVQTITADKPKGAGINDIVCTPPFPVSTSKIAFFFNPNGEILVQDPTTANPPTPLTQADIHLSAQSVADRATIRVFGWTSKARLVNGW